MYSKKDDFLSQLQFELGHRWPDLDIDSIQSIEGLADFILEKHKSSKWPFLNFLPVFQSLKTWIEDKTGTEIFSDFNLNSLSKAQKAEMCTYLAQEFEKPLTFRRPSALKTIVFTAPILLVLFPLLLSTYLITAKDYSGWLYISGIIGLAISLALFKITDGTKKLFDPSSILEYSKSFFVVHNQKLKNKATKDDLVFFLCSAAEKFYKKPFTENSLLPKN